MAKSNNYRKAIVSTLFFFGNSLGLPSPLLWTNFAGIFYWRKYLKFALLKKFAAIALLLGVYVAAHLSAGVQQGYYFKSLAVFLLIISSIPAAYFFIKEQKESLSKYFDWAAILSILLFAISLILLYFDHTWMWKLHNFKVGGSTFFRYQAFAYEPSFYAFLFSPLLIYYLLQTIFHFSKKALIRLLITAIPILSTLSFGFFACLFISLFIGSIVVAFVNKAFFLRISIFLFISVGLGFILVNQVDILNNRIELIMKGQDTSVNGRTSDAFYLADQMLNEKSKIFGIGLGQIKVIGEDYIRPFYGYKKELWPTVAIPNAMAETLAVFGYLGVIIRLAIQFLCFFFFKVYYNLFSLCLFIFLFVYQFMGSFFMSGTELTLWVLACVPLFDQLNISSLKLAGKSSSDES